MKILFNALVIYINIVVILFCICVESQKHHPYNRRLDAPKSRPKKTVVIADRKKKKKKKKKKDKKKKGDKKKKPSPKNYGTVKPMRPVNPSICGNNKRVYQLKMFWERGMEWQETKKETAWCAQCKARCNSGEEVIIKECNKGKDNQQWIFYQCTVRPKTNPNVCITAGEFRGNSMIGRILLRTCDSNKVQLFRTFDPTSSSKEFQFKILKPKIDNLCLTQEHHPWDGEALRFVECLRAEKNDPGVYDDTSRWVVGKFDGHP